MLEAAKAAAAPTTKVVAVTVLTSLDGDDLRSIGVERDRRRAGRAARRALPRSGLDGIVCSGAEVGAAREAWPEGFFVVPGVRPRRRRRSATRSASSRLAKRWMPAPRSWSSAGPITGADDPEAALRAIAATL